MPNNANVLNQTNLPEETLLSIFSYLNSSDLKNVARACRQFKEISQDDSLIFKQNLNEIINRIESSHGFIKPSQDERLNYQELENLLKDRQYIGTVATKFNEDDNEIIYALVNCQREPTIASTSWLFLISGSIDGYTYLQYKIKINKKTGEYKSYLIEQQKNITIDVLLENKEFLFDKLGEARRCENLLVYRS